MGRDLDRKWSDEQRDIVVRAHRIDGLSMSAAGRLVRDSEGRPMPKSTVRAMVQKIGDRYMLRSPAAALARLEQLQAECAFQSTQIAVELLRTGEQDGKAASRLAALDRTAATLAKQAAQLRAAARGAGKPAKPDPEPAPNGRTDEDAAVAAILAGG